MRSRAALLLVVLAGCSLPDDVPAPPAGTVDDADLAALLDASVARVRKSREDADAWAALAMAYDANAFYSLAVPCYRRALVLRSGEARWWYDLAFVLEREDRFDEALEAAGRAAEAAPDYPPLFRSLAFWHVARGRLDDAELAARRAIETSGGGAGAFIALGRVELELGRDAEAAETLAKAVANWPADWGAPSYAHHLLGVALTRLGRAEDAALHSALGRGEPPQFPDPWRAEVVEFREGFAARLVRAHRFVAHDRFDEAIAALTELRARRPQHEQVLTDLGAAYLLTSRWPEAIAVLEECVTAHPGALDPRLQLSRGLWAAGRRDEAMRQASTAVEMNPASGDAFEARGWLELRAGDAEAALADVETASRLDPASASSVALAGAAHLVLERLDRAEAAFGRALAMDPSQTTAIAGLAMAAIRRGDLVSADRHLARIERLSDAAAPLVAEARRQRAAAGR